MPAFADHASETQSLVRSANDLFGVNAASLRALADALRAVGISTWATRGRSPSLAGLSTVRRTLEDMDKRLFGVWRRTVRPDDTIICLAAAGVFCGHPRSPRPRPTPHRRGSARPMTAQKKKAVSERMSTYWARASQGTPRSSPASPEPRQGTCYAAGQRRLPDEALPASARAVCRRKCVNRSHGYLRPRTAPKFVGRRHSFQRHHGWRSQLAINGLSTVIRGSSPLPATRPCE